MQDESESATMSFGGSAHHRQGKVSLHPHQLQKAVQALAAAGAASGAGSQLAGASTTGPRGGEAPGASAGAPAAWQQQLHRHLSGHKHRRETPAAAADTSVGGGRNGSDSGSNTPGDQTPVPDSPPGSRGEEEAADLAPPAKQARASRKQ